MRWTGGRWAGAVLALAAASCSRPDATKQRKPPAKILKLSAARPAQRPPPNRPKPRAPSATPSSSVAAPTGSSSPALTENEFFILDEPVDVGPAGPASASAQGVVMVSRDDRVHLARLRALPAVDTSSTTPIGTLSLSAGDCRAYGRGPALSRGFAYFAGKRGLMRGPVKGGPSELLAADARDAARVAAPADLPKGRDHKPFALYIAKPVKKDGPLRAKLWADGADTQYLNEDQNAAHSVAVAHTPEGYIGLALEARTSMTPIRARVIDTSGATPTLGEEKVVWVGGPATSLIEISAVSAPTGKGGAFAFIALGKSVAEFGLATVDLGKELKVESPARWHLYPNGMDPAPVAGSRGCGRNLVLYARPRDADPDAPSELHLADIGSGTPKGSMRVARSKGFTNVSIAETRSGALISWVADYRTWARTVRCRRSARTTK